MLRNPDHVKEEYLTGFNKKNEGYGGSSINQNASSPTYIVEAGFGYHTRHATNHGMNTQHGAITSLRANKKRPLTIYDENGYALGIGNPQNKIPFLNVK